MNSFRPVKIGKISPLIVRQIKNAIPNGERDSQKVYELMLRHIFQMREGLRKVISEKRR